MLCWRLDVKMNISGEGNIRTRGHQAWAWLGLVIVLALALAACGGSDAVGSAGNTRPQATPDGQAQGLPLQASTQVSEGGQVSVEVTWLGPAAGPVFEVAMNTHSVDLDGYDLAKLAVLRTDKGQEVRPSRWDAPAGGHHRRGTLAFPDKAPDGGPLIGPNTAWIELVIRDVAGVPERVFRWTP